MAFLVTGGGGLIGSHIVRHLVQDGEDVIAYDLFQEETYLEQVLTEEQLKQVKLVKGDITDLLHFIHTVKDNKVDRIIHMAALKAMGSKANPALAVKVNCEGTINVFEAARILELKKVVWASSIAVFGTQESHPEGIIKNDAPHYATSVYGHCKSIDESIATYYFEKYGVDTLGIRYPNVYGVGAVRGTTSMIVQELVEKPASGKAGKVPFSDTIVNWVYGDDAARATVIASKSGKQETRAYTLGGDIYSVKEVAGYVKRLLPKADITLLPGQLDLGGFRFETPFNKDMGYKPKWSLEQGMREVINIVRRRYNLPQV